MISLSRNTETLELNTAEAIVTNELPFMVSYQDIMSPPQGPANEKGTTNGVTAVVISGDWLIDFSRRNIIEVSINNKDTAPHDVIVNFNDGTTLYQIKKINLGVGESLHYESGRGWYVLDKFGAPKENPESNTEDMIYITATTPNAYVASTPKITSYFDGLSIICKFVGNNTGAATLNINGLGAKPVKIFKGSDVTADEIEDGARHILVYDGDAEVWQLMTVTDKIMNAV